MRVTSAAFGEGEAIPAKYSCQGDEVNPPLEITDVPDGAKALAIVVDDPDAPGATYDHWLLWNIPGDRRQIPEHWQLEDGVMAGINGAGNRGYAGPCPPEGRHHYAFKVYALDALLELPEETGKKELEEAMQGHILGQAKLVGTYGRMVA
jgi:Raf kinase inhibitor-like YbhB/YbcL family protein